MSVLDAIKQPVPVPPCFNAQPKHQVSSVPNPFVKGSVMMVRLHMGRWFPSAPITFTATIAVRNGNTEGEHKIEGKDYADLMAQVTAVLEGLP